MLDKVNDEVYFHRFLKIRRKMMRLTLETVANGVCSTSTVQRMERDETVPEKMIRNRIVARLGISREKYEDYLPPKEYERWMLRQDILKSIERKQFLQLEKQLAEYEKKAPDKSVERQFVAAMKFMILKMKDAPLWEQREMIEKAVKETVKMQGENFPKDLLLADQEINLLIEYVALHGLGVNEKDVVEWRLREYREIIAYIEDSQMDNLGKVKIYPKVVYYWMKLNCEYYKAHSLELPWEIVEYGLEICEKAVELLRDIRKLFYFMELLELRKVFCYEKLKYVIGQEAKELNELVETTVSWYEVLMGLYEEYEVSAYMEHFCHLYWEMQSYPMGEVVQIRRKMMGMTKEDLSDDTCDLKSITRCEKKRVKTQKYTIRGVFPKVKLGVENVCGYVVTNDAEALELYDKITRYANIGDLEKLEDSLNQLEKRLRMDIPENKQAIDMFYDMLLWFKKMISDEEFYINSRSSLENTISLESIVNHEKRYLTQKELYCAYRSAMGKEVKERERYLMVLKAIFEEYQSADCITPYIREYEFIMTEISSWLGDVQRYDESNEISGRVIKECLIHRRIGVLGANCYHILWNNCKIMEKEIVGSKDSLKKCMYLFEIAKKKKLVMFLADKITNIN